MKKNLEDFIRKDIDILLEDENLTKTLSWMIISYIDGDDWQDTAFDFLVDAELLSKKIVKENEEAGL